MQNFVLIFHVYQKKQFLILSAAEKFGTHYLDTIDIPILYIYYKKIVHKVQVKKKTNTDKKDRNTDTHKKESEIKPKDERDGVPVPATVHSSPTGECGRLLKHF